MAAALRSVLCGRAAAGLRVARAAAASPPGTRAASEMSKDMMPGPYPRTPEERAAAAKKYNMRVEDYQPYPDDGFGYGDYPMLPNKSHHERDPWYQWDQPDMRHNWGEPIHWDFDMYLRTRVDTSPTVVPWHTMRNHFLIFLSTMLIMFGLGQIYPSYRPVGPKQYPFNDLYLEKGGDPNKEPPVSSKVLAKKELSYMPIIGWMWYFLEIVFCKRKWEEDRKTVIQKLLSLRDYPENFWFLIHCEGTRFTEQKHQISMQVAEAKGLPKLKYHLLPRTKGFAVTVQCLRNVVSAVYDSTLNFRNNENPTLLGVLNGKKYHADLYVRRIPLEEVPEDEQECSTWLHKLYQEKDAFQEEYYRTGTYPAVPIVPPHRPWTLLNWLFWALLLLYPLFKLLINMINSGSSLTLASFAFVIIIASVGVRWMIGVTEINKGSTYGNNDNKQKQK